MKVLVITSSYPRYPGDGVAPFVDSIVRGVAALGHELHVLLPEHREWGWHDDGAVHFHRYRYSPSRSWTPWGFSESLGRSGIRKALYPLAPIVATSAAWAARRILATGGFDVVHSHWVVPNGPIARIAAGSTPLVVSLHGSDVAIAERSRVLRSTAGWTFARAAAVTAPSGDLLERARQLGAHEPLECIPYGANAVELSASSDDGGAVRARLGVGRDDVLVVGLGRLIPVKGFDVLLDAFAAASVRDGRLRLAIVGDGSERERLTERASSLGLGERATFTGAVGHNEVPEVLAAADVVAVPSVHHGGYVDGLPNVALEAMGAGRALVATRVGGLPELVRPDETGLLVDEKDPEGLADALVALARDPELRARLGRHAQAEIREHRSWHAVAERFVGVYDTVIRR